MADSYALIALSRVIKASDFARVGPSARAVSGRAVSTMIAAKSADKKRLPFLVFINLFLLILQPAGTPRRPVHPSAFLTKRSTATRLKTHPNAN